MADEINQSGYPQTPTSMSGLVQPPTDREKINSSYEPGSQVPLTPTSQSNAQPNDSFTPLLQPPGKAGGAAFSTESKFSTQPVGSSGTQLYGGYFAEEYLQNLRGRLGAIKWDEMRRSEPQIAMLIGAIFNAIKSANWEFESFRPGEAEFDKHRDLVEHVMTRDIHLETYKHESLTHVMNGFACFEKIHSAVIDDPQFGTYTGLRALAWRSPKTIYRWNLEKKTGKLLGVEQYVFSDIGDNVYIPGQFLMVITHNKEGDNIEGIGVLRAMLGPWERKNLYQKLVAIGIEKYAIGTPVGTVPAGKEDTEEMTNFKKILSAYTSHQQAFITVAEGWKIEIQQGNFDPSKIKEMIVLENTEMINAALANFLALGMSGAGGAFALSGDLSDFFLKGIQCIADNICTTTDRGVIEDIVKLNFGPQLGYPRMKISGINDKAGKELAEAMRYIIMDARAIKPDEPLEAYLRKLYRLPKADPTTQKNYVVAKDTAVVSDPSAPPPPENEAKPATRQFSELRLAEDKNYKKRFDADKAEIKNSMRDQLLVVYKKFRSDIEDAYNGAQPSARIKSVLVTEAPGKAVYKKMLQGLLAEKASGALTRARKLVPSKKNVKLDEAEYDALPPRIRKIIDAQAEIISDTQLQDLEKVVYFQFASSAGTEDDIDRVLNDIDEKILPTLTDTNGQSMGINLDAAAGDVLAQIERQTEKTFFFDDEVLNDVESFTFVNEDPVSEICQELVDTTLDANDPDLDTYWTPLHHNCKSRWAPNLKGDDSNPDVDRNGVNLSKKALDSMTLSEVKNHRIFSTLQLGGPGSGPHGGGGSPEHLSRVTDKLSATQDRVDKAKAKVSELQKNPAFFMSKEYAAAAKEFKSAQRAHQSATREARQALASAKAKIDGMPG